MPFEEVAVGPSQSPVDSGLSVDISTNGQNTPVPSSPHFNPGTPQSEVDLEPEVRTGNIQHASVQGTCPDTSNANSSDVPAVMFGMPGTSSGNIGFPVGITDALGNDATGLSDNDTNDSNVTSASTGEDPGPGSFLVNVTSREAGGGANKRRNQEEEDIELQDKNSKVSRFDNQNDKDDDQNNSMAV